MSRTKLRQLGPTNQIIKDLDFKPSECERPNLSDLKSDDEFGLRLKDDVKIGLKLNNF